MVSNNFWSSIHIINMHLIYQVKYHLCDNFLEKNTGELLKKFRFSRKATKPFFKLSGSGLVAFSENFNFIRRKYFPPLCIAELSSHFMFFPFPSSPILSPFFAELSNSKRVTCFEMLGLSMGAPLVTALHCTAQDHTYQYVNWAAGQCCTWVPSGQNPPK